MLSLVSRNDVYGWIRDDGVGSKKDTGDSVVDVAI